MVKKQKSNDKSDDNDDKYFQYAVRVALNHQKVQYNPESITKIKPFIDQHNWKEITFLYHIKSIGKNLN